MAVLVGVAAPSPAFAVASSLSAAPVLDSAPAFAVASSPSVAAVVPAFAVAPSLSAAPAFVSASTLAPAPAFAGAPALVPAAVLAAAPAPVTVARYTFDGGAGATGRVAENSGRGTALTVRAADRGRVTFAGTAADKYAVFPAACPAKAASCPRALLDGTDDPDLDPGIADAKWHDIMCQRSGAVLSVYVDGQMRGQMRGRIGIPATLSIANNRPLRIGGPNLNAKSEMHHGQLDDVYARLG